MKAIMKAISVPKMNIFHLFSKKKFLGVVVTFEAKGLNKISQIMGVFE